MLPVIQLGPLSLPTYPLALLLAVWAALAVGAWAARREGLDGDHIYNAGLYGLVAGLVAARLAHVIVYWDAYRTQLLEIFGFNQRAFLPWPGVIAALAVAGWYVYRHRLPLVKVLDAIAPGVLVGIAIVDVAALLTGRNAGAAGAARRALGGEPVGRAAPPCPDLRGVGRVGRGCAGAVDDRTRQPARLSGVGRAVRLRVEPVAAGAVPRAGGECDGSGWAAPGASGGAGRGGGRAVGTGSARFAH